MSMKRSTFVLATVLFALASTGSIVRAADYATCHWHLPPGAPLDPNTSYPKTLVDDVQSPPATVKEILERMARKPLNDVQSPPATVKEILERIARKPQSVSR